MTKFSFLKSAPALLLLTGALAVSGCKDNPQQKSASADRVAAPVLSPIEAAIAAPSRSNNAKRDEFRNPKATLEFFKVTPDTDVLEISPGGGWYADILGAVADSGTGTYMATTYPETGARAERRAKANAKFKAKFPNAVTYEFGGKSKLPEGVADRVLTFRNVHNWMGSGNAEDVFAQFYDALKPGGMLGVVEHRLPATMGQDPRAPSGYVQEAYVKALAKEAGFKFVAASEINANPKDTANHPYGVWTLPPRLRGPKEGEDAAGYDKAKYEAMGESDRMTLLFKKPG